MSQTEVQLIKADAVQTADIANSAVTDAKISALTSSKLTGALPAISGASLTNLPTPTAKAKNLIINGDFRIAQRGTSSTSNGYKTNDRWANYSGSHGTTVTFSQQSTVSSDTPYQNGFSNFFRFALSGAGTANAGAYLELMQTIEAQNIANSGWNFKSSSSNITVSFWLRASTNQTFYGFLRTYDGSAYVYAFSFTASGNNTWTKITKTIPGNSNLQFDNNNLHGLQIMLTPFFGTTYTNNRTLNTWNALDSANYFPDMASTWLTAGASTFDITGVQIEVGSVATDFEHMSFGEQIKLCERYYQKIDSAETTGNASHAYLYRQAIPFRTEMRATPTFNSSTFGSDSGTATPSAWSSGGYLTNLGAGATVGSQTHAIIGRALLEAEL